MLLQWLFNKTWMYALVGLFVVGFIYRVYKAGQDKEKLEQLSKEFDAVVRRNEIEDDVERLSDSDVIKQLREYGWIRNKDSS